MSKRSDPWFKFYPSDWRAEPSLRAVSMAARGLWIEMLCLMHEAEPRGHLLLNGRPVTDAQLAALAGVPVNTAQELLGELETSGTFSRTRAGVIYSRRMRTDTAVSAKQRKNVSKRWENQPPQDAENKDEKGIGNTKHDTKPIPKKPEARDTIPNGIDAGPSPDLDKRAWDEAVVSLHRGGLSEQKARAFFGKLLRDNHLTARDLLPSLLNAQINGTQDPQGYLTKAAAAVARQRGTAPAAVPIAQWDDGRWSAVLALNREEGWWQDSLGPKPGEPGCRVPAHLIERQAA